VRDYNVTIDMEGMRRFGVEVQANDVAGAIQQAWARWRSATDRALRVLADHRGYCIVTATPKAAT
jgi:hypothetical protein